MQTKTKRISGIGLLGNRVVVVVFTARSLSAEFFATAQWRMPKRKTAVTLSVDDDVLKWFEAQGAEFQQHINAASRIYAEAHQE